MQIFLLILLILVNGFFALAELSLLAAKKSRLLLLAENGNLNAVKALQLVENPSRIIAVSQIGLTVITLVEGAATNSILAPFLMPMISASKYLLNYAGIITLTLSFIIITSLTILFSDILAKRIALIYPETIAVTLIPLTSRIIILLSPLIKIFSYLSDKILQLLGMPTLIHESVSAEDIESMIEAGARSGVLDATEQGLLGNVWRMDERKVGAIMTPDIIFIDVNASYQDNLSIILEHPAKRIIVCIDNLDHVLGYGIPSVWLKEILHQTMSGIVNPKVNWRQDLMKVHAIPNTLTLIEMLDAFRKYKTSVALVYNEFGRVEGLITMTDLMSAVVGEYPENAEENLLIIQDSSGKWLIDGLAALDDVKKALNIGNIAEDESNTYHTMSGFMFAIIGSEKGRLPKEFDRFDYSGYTFEIVDIERENGYRIDRVMVQPIK